MSLADILNRREQEPTGPSAQVRRCLAYARVSTDDQERAGLSIPAQIRAMEDYARGRDLLIVEVYREAQSAFSDESRRSEFCRMVERAKSDRDISCILVHDFSRFFRDPYRGPMVKGELQAHDVKVVSVTEPEYDPRTVAGLAIEKMTEFKNASYSLDVAFHTRKGMKENLARRDPEIPYCYKNGGAPPWGFKAYKVQRGTDRKAAPIMKTLWDKDDQVVAGRPVWEWARHVLIELRLKGSASLDQVRDFLNERRIPAPRKQFWGISTLHSLLQPSALLQFAGYGLWNVRGRHGRKRPTSEWEIVPDAHPAIITLEEGEAILKVNARQSQVAKDRSNGRMALVRTQGSRYLLTGGLFLCKRCGANMVGYRNCGRLYYVCGSKAYRKGLGCGQPVQIRKEEIEAAAVEEITRLFESWADTKRMAEAVNADLRALHQQQAATSIEIARRLREIEFETGNIYKAIRAGLDDVQGVNAELQRLKDERDQLLNRQQSLGEEPQVPEIDMTKVEEYRRRFAEVLDSGNNEAKRDLARLFLNRIEVDPETGAVWMHLYSRPPIIAKTGTPAFAGVPIGLVAGAGFEPATYGL